MRTDIRHFASTLSPAKIGMVCAWVGVLIYAASNSIVKMLVDVGAANPLADGRNAIAYTNLYIMGSLISLIPMILLFRSDWTRVNLSRLSNHDWMLLTLSALLSSALTPGLFFYALEHSTVTNVVLVSRIEPPLFLLAAGVFLKERINPHVLLAGIIALLGAVLMICLGNANIHGHFGPGEMAAALATLSYIASAIIAKKALARIPMGVFSIYRTAVGTVIYVVLISALKGPQEFQDVFSPVLLKWVWVYAIIVVVIGQLVWFVALKQARSDDLSLATSFSPLAGIAFAVLLLGEDSGPGFIPGGALILLAIYVGQSKGAIARPLHRGTVRLRRAWQTRPDCAPGEIAQIVAPIAALYGRPIKV